MKRRMFSALLLAGVGCTTCPQAGLMDRLFPSRNACCPTEQAEVCAAPILQPAPIATVRSEPLVPMTPVAAPIQMLPAQTVVAPALEYPTVPPPTAAKRSGHRWFRWFRRDRR